MLKKTVLLLLLVTTCASAFAKASLCIRSENNRLCEQVGQMLIVGFGGFKQDDNGNVLWNDHDGTEFKISSLIARHIADNHVGGVILFLKTNRDIKTGAFIRDRNIQNPVQVAKLNKDLQDYNNQVRKEQGLKPLPLFISVDQEGGKVDRLPAALGFSVATLLPQALGANEDNAIKGFFVGSEARKKRALTFTYNYADRLAKELAVLNFNVNFAPVVDVNVNPVNPIIGGLGRSFSSNPEVVVDQAKQFIRAFNENKIATALKHFPGHGSSTGDTHLGFVDVTDTYKKGEELYPYSTLIKEGYNGMVMTTHVINGQIDKTQCQGGDKNDRATWCPGTMSQATLTELLRNKMGFKGIIVSDDMTMGAIANKYELSVALEKGINAGVDLFIVANNYSDQTDEVVDTIVRLVREGRVKQERIAESYNRIADFKKRYYGEWG